MTRFAPPLVLECPKCGDHVLRRRLALFNDFGVSIHAAFDEKSDGDVNLLASRRATAATGITEQSLRDTFARKFPQLSKALDAMLKRGNEGKKGGVVLIKPGEDVAQVFADKTGVSLEQARKSLQMSIADDGSRFSVSRKINKAIIALQNGSLDIEESINLGETPQALKNIGVASHDLVIDGSVIDKALKGKHGAIITADSLKEAVAGLFDPLMVFDSKSHQDSIVVVTEAKSRLGDPLIVAIHIGKQSGRAKINDIASVYGKENTQKAFDAWATDGNLRYFRDEESLVKSSTHRLQLLRVVQIAQGLGKTVLSKGVDVKKSQDGQIQAFFDPASGITFMVAENLDADTAANVLLHEAVHGNQRDNVDAAGVRLLTKVRKIAGGKLREVLDEAANRMVAAGAAKWDGKELNIADTKEAAPSDRQ